MLLPIVRRHDLQLFLSLILLLMLASPVGAGTSNSGARSLFFDPSTRSAALGGAGASLWWGSDPNAWANPALLPLHDGIHYSEMNVDLIPQLSSDIHFTSQRLTLGWEEFGLLVGGKFGLPGGGRYDMGTQNASDESGSDLGGFSPWSETESLGLAVDLVGLSHRLGWPQLTPERWTVSVGHTWKSYEDELVPAYLIYDNQDGGTSAKARDLGVFVRWTPLNSFNGSDPCVFGFKDARLDIAAGWSKLNYNGARVIYVDSEQADPIAKVGHLSGSISLAAGQLEETTGDDWGSIFRRGFTPLFRAAVIFDRRGFNTPSNSDGPRDWDNWDLSQHETGYGIELTVGNILSYRLGHIDDKTDNIMGGTSGWSLGYQFGNIAGFRYDSATVPQSTGLNDVTRTGWTVYFNAIELFQGRSS